MEEDLAKGILLRADAEEAHEKNNKQTKNIKITNKIIITIIIIIKVLFPDFVWKICRMLDFGYFVFFWWQTDKKQEILKQGCKGLFT